MMTLENMILIREAVSEAGDFLKGKLEPTPEIPHRNSYAHIWKKIKNEMGKTYKDCADADVQKILDIIQDVKKVK